MTVKEKKPLRCLGSEKWGYYSSLQKNGEFLLSLYGNPNLEDHPILVVSKTYL